MMIHRAAGGAAKRLLLVWIVAAIVVLIGLTVFNRDYHMSDWAWRWQVHQETGL